LIWRASAAEGLAIRLAERAAQPTQLRAGLKDMPPLNEARLWTVQARAIRNLEQ
jgi:hypothetical protein